MRWGWGDANPARGYLGTVVALPHLGCVIRRVQVNRKHHLQLHSAKRVRASFLLYHCTTLNIFCA